MQAVRTYKENEDLKLTGAFISPEAYEEVSRGMIIVCADAVPVQRETKHLPLPSRCIKPMKGTWIIGGRINRGESREKAVQRHFFIDTGLELAVEQFHYLYINEYLWADREQMPQDVGSHNYAFTYLVDLTDEQLRFAQEHLNAKEYDTQIGIQRYDLPRLQMENAHPALLDLYTHIFPIGTD